MEEKKREDNEINFREELDLSEGSLPTIHDTLMPCSILIPVEYNYRSNL